jgi:hypothetical protein
MRENRPSGSEGGGTETNRSFPPLFTAARGSLVMRFADLIRVKADVTEQVE